MDELLGLASKVVRVDAPEFVSDTPLGDLRVTVDRSIVYPVSSVQKFLMEEAS